MRQYLQLDRLLAPVYLGLLVVGCRPVPGRVVPLDATPVDQEQVAAWVQATTPPVSRLHQFKWLFQDERGSLGGRGAARVAPPDSLRFDAEAVYGSETRSAVVIGDTTRWVEPPDALRRLVPNYTLLWGMFGVARAPAPGAALHGLTDGAMTAWRYVTQTDTVDYAYTRGTPSKLVTEVRHAGEVVGRAEATLAPDGALRQSKLTVPSVPAKLELTFLSTTRTAFDSTIWLRRNP